MQRPSHQLPTFTPGARLSRLPAKNNQSLEDYYRDLFANTGPEHDRQRLLQLLDLDVDNGAAAQGRMGALDNLGRAFGRIDAWTYQGDYLPQADRTELKRRVAHNLLAVFPGLDVTATTAPTSPDHAILRQVQDEHAVWRRGLWDDPNAGQRSRQPWSEQAPRQGQGVTDALRHLGYGEPLRLVDVEPGPADDRQPGAKKTYWYVTPKPTACDNCLAMAGRLSTEEPERPHPNCKCRIESRELTRQQAAALQGDLARQAQALHAEHDRIQREEQAAKIKAKTPAYVDDSQWQKDGDPVTVSGKDKKDRSVHQTFKGHVLPDKTKGGVKIKVKDDKQIDRRVAKKMSDTLQTVLDDPRCKEAGITEVTVSSTTDGQHAKPEDRHYQGKAVDISRINGKSIAGSEKAQKQAKIIQEVVKEKANELGIKDNLGPGRLAIYDHSGRPLDLKDKLKPHDGHVHIAIY